MVTFRLSNTKRLSASKMYLARATSTGQPMHYKEITDKALDLQLLATKGKTLNATMNSQIVAELNSKTVQSRFTRTGAGKYALVKWNNP